MRGMGRGLVGSWRRRACESLGEEMLLSGVKRRRGESGQLPGLGD